MINFNEAPFLGTELECIKDAIARKHICGNGEYTKRCNALLEKRTVLVIAHRLSTVKNAALYQMQFKSKKENVA